LRAGNRPCRAAAGHQDQANHAARMGRSYRTRPPPNRAQAVAPELRSRVPRPPAGEAAEGAAQARICLAPVDQRTTRIPRVRSLSEGCDSPAPCTFLKCSSRRRRSSGSGRGLWPCIAFDNGSRLGTQFRSLSGPNRAGRTPAVYASWSRSPVYVLRPRKTRFRRGDLHRRRRDSHPGVTT
jgi:hypothetical protein